jgi:protein-disulfide isomerase/uncharacterized membrane protein
MDVRAQQPVSPHRLIAGVRLSSLVGLASSSMAAADAYFGNHAFCSSGSGCDVVRRSSLGQALGMGLPVLGVLCFGGLALASLSSSRSLRLATAVAAMTGGVAGAALLLLQAFAIGALCSVCAGADVSAIVAAVCALPLLLRRPNAWAAPGPRAQRLWLAAIVLALGAPPAWALSRPATVPSYVRALSRPNAINVVELSDFECPFCRAMHPALKAALLPYGGRVHFVRQSYPLAGHRHARDAARAYVCAQQQGQSERMADWLFASPDISAASCGLHAAAFGLDRARFAACVRAPETDQRIDRDMAQVEREGFHGLPLVYIGEQALLGFDASAGAKPYAAALARAAQRGRPWTASAPSALLMLCVTVLLLSALRSRT